MSQGRGSSQISNTGPVGHPHVVNIVTISEEKPTGQRGGDLWIKLPPGYGPFKVVTSQQEEPSGERTDDA